MHFLPNSDLPEENKTDKKTKHGSQVPVILPALACVASVPARGERGLREGVFRIRAAGKMGRSKKVEGEGWGRGAKGTLARNPLDSEKRPPTAHRLFTVDFTQ